MSSEGKLGNLGEPTVSLLLLPEDEGYRLIKSPGVSGELPSPHEPEGTQTEEADKVLGKRAEAKRPKRDSGQS